MTPWVNAQVAYLLAVRLAAATIKDGKAVVGESDPSEYDEIVTKTIDAFSSHVIHTRMRMFTLERESMWWLRLYAWKIDLYPRDWWYRMFIWSCTVASRMSLWWWEIVWCIPRPWGRRPQWQGQSQSHRYQRPLCRSVGQRCQKGSMVIKCPS